MKYTKITHKENRGYGKISINEAGTYDVLITGKTAADKVKNFADPSLAVAYVKDTLLAVDSTQDTKEAALTAAIGAATLTAFNVEVVS